MRTFYLHIGHGKTGSTMLQSSFWLSRDILQNKGIAYPTGSETAMVNERQITSGNGSGLVARPERLAAVLADSDASQNMLFSSELLFAEMLQNAALDQVIEQIAQAGFDKIAILLFVRNPMGHASSLWQQGIKRSGKSNSIEQFYQSYKFPQLVAGLVEKLQKIPKVDLTLRNYSACRKTLLAETESWLNLAKGTLIAPEAERINRSMTRSELELQLAFNRVLGKCGDLISDPLCENLTDIVPDDIRPPQQIQAATWKRLAAHIQKVNRFLPEGHEYKRDIKPPSDTDALLTFTPAQIEIIVASIGERFIKHRELKQKIARKSAAQ